MRWDEVKRALPDDIKEAIFFVMKKKGLSQEEVGMRLGVTRTTFIGWFKGKISLRHVVAICIAMDVRFDISMEFVRLAGWFRKAYHIEPDYMIRKLKEESGWTE